MKTGDMGQQYQQHLLDLVICYSIHYHFHCFTFICCWQHSVLKH